MPGSVERRHHRVHAAELGEALRARGRGYELRGLRRRSERSATRAGSPEAYPSFASTANAESLRSRARVEIHRHDARRELGVGRLRRSTSGLARALAAARREQRRAATEREEATAGESIVGHGPYPARRRCVCPIGCNSSCDGVQVEVDASDGETLLTVLREQLGVVSVKDGCAPQGQCGCCTVLIDGEPRVVCVTPASRVDGPPGDDGRRPRTCDCATHSSTRSSPAAARSAASALPASSCRAAHLIEKGRTTRADIDRALAAHLCRCTGWQPIVESISLAAAAISSRRCPPTSRRVTSTPRRGGPSSKAASRSGSIATFRSARAGSPTTPRRAMRRSTCRGPSTPTCRRRWRVTGSG